MTTSRVIYKGNQRTTCTHLKSQSTVDTDAPTDNQGKGERFSPTDLMATSLAACMLTIMAQKAESMEIDIEEITIDVEKIMVANPRKISEINLTVHIPDRLATIDPKTATILKNAGRACPVAKSIHPDIDVHIDWTTWQ